MLYFLHVLNIHENKQQTQWGYIIILKEVSFHTAHSDTNLSMLASSRLRKLNDLCPSDHCLLSRCQKSPGNTMFG